MYLCMQYEFPLAFLLFFFLRKSKTHTVKTRKGISLLPWKHVTALLEVMPVLVERMGAESYGLVPPLFSCLTWSFEEREISNEDTLDYTQQLILSNLLKIYNILGDKETRGTCPRVHVLNVCNMCTCGPFFNIYKYQKHVVHTDHVYIYSLLIKCCVCVCMCVCACVRACVWEKHTACTVHVGYMYF